MENLARKQERNFVSHGQPDIAPKKAPLKRRGITPGEKILGILFVAFICIVAVRMVSTQASIYGVNKHIQDVESTIHEQKKSNNDLEMQISELSRFERIKKEANKLGLKLNEDNVKVVDQK
ncbi:cell division protein FtsL [Falsibacillus albus]|uniref:Cell division protein FtsL n=1 Tax=Falsibacillus albus TaxID=2478915 RepID=A0A3L7JYI0_9BACI|nr:cell division protein FtsL [Falsibacillus albus]RLQ95836.1 cell division protein FtsL [Falsibacillus albus]